MTRRQFVALGASAVAGALCALLMDDDEDGG